WCLEARDDDLRERVLRKTRTEAEEPPQPASAPAPMACGALAPTLSAQGRRQANEDFGRDGRSEIMRKFFEFGGVVAAVVLVAFGITAIVMGVNGRNTVSHSLKQEYIVGSSDMTPATITAEAKKAGLDVATLDIPAKSVANKPITTGERARTFAGYMRIHALEASGGLTYAQMGRYVAKPGTPKQFTDGHGATSIDTWALLD